MVRVSSRHMCLLLVPLAFLIGCAGTLPATYGPVDSAPVVEGPIRALAGEGDLVAAVNDEGLFIKEGDGEWAALEVPGIRNWNLVTCLAVERGVIYLGSDGEGLHIYSDGLWEVKTSRYGGLADDGVLSVALEGPDGGLQGGGVWVGTREGVSEYRDGKWTVYRPGGDWLVAMTGKGSSGTGKVYVGSGFNLGRRNEDSELFRPPVSAIGVGPGRVVFGNRESGLALVTGDAAAVLKFEEKREFTRLVVEKDVVWAGTDKGLLWGGIKGRVEGEPWPTNTPHLTFFGTLFGSRDTRDFEYRWKLVGYNTAQVSDLERKDVDIWVALRSVAGSRTRQITDKGRVADRTHVEPITDVRRYVNAQEYILRREKFMYESYGTSVGIKGEPDALYVTPDDKKVYIGTTKGLWELQTY